MKKIYILAAVAALIVLSLFALMIRISVKQKSSFDILLEETRRNAEQISLLNRTMQRIGDDSNEVRGLLYLDPVHYSATPSIESDDGQKDKFDVFINAFRSFDDYYSTIEHTNALSSTMNNPLLKQFYKKNNLILYLDHASFLIKGQLESSSDNVDIFSGGWNGKSCTVSSKVTSNSYADDLDAFKIEAFLKKELEQISEKVKQYKTFISTYNLWAQKNETFMLLDNNRVVFEPTNPGMFEKRLLLRTSDFREIGYVTQDEKGKINFADDQWDSLNSFLNSFPDVLKEIDTRSFGAIKTDEVVEALKATFSDEEFRSILEAYDAEISQHTREDDDFIYFDIIKHDTPYGSFGVLKQHGELYILDPDDVPILSLETANSDSIADLVRDSGSEKKNSAIAEDSLTTVLLCGSHEKNPDTMILYVGSKTSNQAYLFSLPRDLYYKGQKLNNIYRHFGPEQFLADISDITGLEIKNYINIDMYAFIDVINIIGGVEVTLSEPLVDPTYRIKENGIWNTLHYNRGTHQLDGLGALRIARSRHTSSDFERAERQQLIISSLMKKFSNTANNDVSTMYKLLQTALKYVSTNISPIEVINLAGNLKNVSIEGQYVLSTGNVLYHTTSPSGLWILLPKDDNWNNIVKFIKSKLQFEY